MAFARWERPIQDGAGNLIADVWCEVRREDIAGSPKATLYSDRAGASILANPFLAADGIPAFHAAGGSYRVRIYKAGYDETFRYQAVGTGAEIDADTLLIPGYLFEFEGETSAPPGEGGIRADNAALGSATRLFIDKETVAGVDVSARIAALDGKRILLTSTNAGEQVSWDIDLVTDEGSYYELVLSAHSGAESIAAGRCGMQPEPSQGPAGLDGLFSGEEVELTGASETLITAYRGQTVILNRATAMALAAQPAATLGANWAVMIMNVGAGEATLDPDGAETVDGAATLAIRSGDSLILSSNGTLLRTELVSRGVQPVDHGGTGGRSWPAALAGLAAQSIVGHSNLALAASVASNILTVAVKGTDGNNPSADNPVCFAFRDATQTSGLPVVRTVTAALSVSLPNGATAGFASGSAGRLWVVAFDDGGTVRLGLINCLSGASIYPLRSHRFASSTATGTGSDNAHTFYTTTAVTSKPYIVLGHLDWSGGLVTAGAWASAPTLVQTLTPHVQLPGDVVQVQRTDDGAAATGSTGISFDDSVPQNTEGDQFLSQAITVQAAPNVLQTRSEVMLAVSNQTVVTMALFRDSTAAALTACGELPAAANNPFVLQLHHAAKAGAAAATTMKVRLGRNSSGTVTLNGAGGGRSLGGASNSYIEVSEIVA